MKIQLIKAFFKSELHRNFIQKHLCKKISSCHPDYVLLDNGFTEYAGIYAVWYNYPIEDGQMTSDIETFVSLRGLIFKIKCFLAKRIKFSHL